MNRILPKYLRREDGGLVVEAALLLPFIVSAGLGGLDASYMLLQNHRLESQLQTASSYLSKSDDPASKETLAKQLAMTGSLDGSGDLLLPGITANDISITYETISNQSGLYRGDDTIKTVKVSAQFDYQGFGILSSLMPDGAFLTASVEERVVGGGL